jgi:hypothetical protein
VFGALADVKLAALGLALDEQLDSREACDTPPR